MGKLKSDRIKIAELFFDAGNNTRIAMLYTIFCIENFRG